MKFLKYMPLLMVAALWSCDEVDEGDRYIEMPTIEAQKAVLVLDFTGQECTNCPKAHLSIESMQEQYSDAFIPVSIHAGVQSLSYTSTRRVGLATPLGETYDTYFGIAPHGYPSIVVDYNSSSIYSGTSSEWVDPCRNAMAKEAIVQMSGEARCTADAEGNVTIDVTTTMMASQDLKCKLQLWIIEDSIVAPQKGVDDDPGWDNTYVHNDVLRAAVNGDWGQDVNLEDNVFTTSSASFTITTDWEKTWVVENLRVVAFCYTDADGVLQAIRVPVIASL